MKKLIKLTGNKTELILLVIPSKFPEIIYWGKKLSLTSTEEAQFIEYSELPVPQAFLDDEQYLTIFPLLGNGAFQLNAFSGSRGQQSWAPQFRQLTYREASSGSLEIDARDEIAGLQLTIKLELNNWDILEQEITLTNIVNDSYQLNELFISLALPAKVNEMIQFHGRWIHEFQQQRSLINQPCYLVENLKGRTSNDNPPLLICGSNGFSHQAGEVYAFHLGWSGNHAYKLSMVSDGRKLVQFGEKFLPGEMTLSSGATYTSPKLYATYSDGGLNQLSHNFHAFIRESGRFAKHKRSYRPIHINTWEAMYFEHNQEMLFKLVYKAASLGIERFVLDDGWFNGRNHERAGLGDWFVDKNKYPNGLTPLIEQVKKSGMELGLWFEPEMVNPDSELFRKHPDWVLHLAGYQQPLGRYQYVLNLAHPEAYSYIKTCMVDLLNQYDIAYIKWDMNRDLVQPGNSLGYSGVHDQVLATYRLMDELNQLFPRLEIESCASGGARVDLGILRYTNRVWTSDCNDPVERQSIQEGFSYFFPPELMGSHFGPEQAHTTNRLNTLEYRILTAFFANLGFEQNLLELTAYECTQLKTYIDLYKKYRSLIHRGDFIWLDTLDPGQKIYGVISADKTQALFAVAQNGFPVNQVSSKLMIPYLDESKNYRVKLLNSQENTGYLMKKSVPLCNGELLLSGKVIANLGIQLPIMHPQSILLIAFTSN
ncbi:alpha-galactosidase [Aquella oligotrophica]|uniref:Alpha-galactosidase n=1 Tax=Aquella oligotrophica TaxID=2067065 RepID=A0A2I7N3Y4_9NEIS|nr:alpha-galactosidase [Aquella oligotrophica]AUR51162.1 alpha-galactosidase [Aquella oligotrophica]